MPKGTRPTSPKPRTTTKARNRECNDVRNPKETDVENTICEGKQGNEEKKPEEQIIDLRKELEVLNQKQTLEIEALRSEISVLTREKEAISMISFHIDNIKHDEDKFHFYTGLPDYQTLKILHNSFGTATGKLIYHDSKTNADKITEEGKRSGPKCSLSSEQELFLVLARLRCGLLEVDIAQRVGISSSHVSRIFISWIDFLHSRLRALPIWPTRDTVDKTMPKCFKETYPSTRVIIDATEISIEMPSSLRTQSESYSSYKHHNTTKGLIGIAPSGSVPFVSDLYAGDCSDKAVTNDCGILDLLKPGDSVMADKGFSIEMTSHHMYS